MMTSVIDGNNSNVVSFDKCALKLDKADDAQEIVERINEHINSLHTLILSGNTLGIEAGEAIGKALKTHSELTKALWSDMFTGRSKDIIAPALSGLSKGVILSGAQLVELDLRDNAFGPTGVVGVTELIGSRCCHTLKILRMDNEGLGHQGCRLLAEALTKSLDESEANGKMMRLEVFTAARNRLENEGMKMLSPVFQRMGSLKELTLFQNGIGIHGVDGCEALARALAQNTELVDLNLSDNSLTPKGIRILADCAFPQLERLKVLNISDCILRSKGAQILANCLCESLPSLTDLYLSGNEIHRDAAVGLVLSLQNKASTLQTLDLNSNELGEDGVVDVRETLASLEMGECLASLSDDEGGDGEDEEGEDEDEETYEEYDDDEEEDEDEDEEEDEAAETGDSANTSKSPFSFKAATTSLKPTSLFEGLPICSPGSFGSIFPNSPASKGPAVTQSSLLEFGAGKKPTGGLFGDGSSSPSSSLFGTPSSSTGSASLFKTPASRPAGGLFGSTTTSPAQNGTAAVKPGRLFAPTTAADVWKDINELLKNPQACKEIVPRIAAASNLTEEAAKIVAQDQSRVEVAVESCIECAGVDNGAPVCRALLDAAVAADSELATNCVLVQLGLIKGEKKVKRKLTVHQGQVFFSCLKDCMAKGEFSSHQAQLVSFFLSKGPSRPEAEALRSQHKSDIEQLTRSIEEKLKI